MAKKTALDSPSFYNWAMGTNRTELALSWEPPGRGKHKGPYKTNTVRVPKKYSSWEAEPGPEEREREHREKLHPGRGSRQSLACKGQECG